MKAPTLAVCLHDVEPRALERCIFIRQWLADRGVARLTLLAIPSPEARPLEHGGRCASWLRTRAADGDAVAQHGLHHHRRQPASRARDWIADLQGGQAAEFVGLSRAETIAAIQTGRAILSGAGLTPRGFVAPAYAYTRPLRRELRGRFAWYAGLLAIHAPRPIPAPAHGLGTSTAFKRRASPATLRIGASAPAGILRVDVHPADFDLARHVTALDAVLRQARRRASINYDDLAT